jgi:hypothetical protein
MQSFSEGRTAPLLVFENFEHRVQNSKFGEGGGGMVKPCSLGGGTLKKLTFQILDFKTNVFEKSGQRFFSLIHHFSLKIQKVN